MDKFEAEIYYKGYMSPDMTTECVLRFIMPNLDPYLGAFFYRGQGDRIENDYCDDMNHPKIHPVPRRPFTPPTLLP